MALAATTGLIPALRADHDDGGALQLTRIVTGLARPIFLTHAPGDTDRLFILEQHQGQIRIFKKSTQSLLPTPFLAIAGVNTNNEEGLLGLAFHPDYQTNGYFYVYFTDSVPGRHSFIRRYQVSANPDLATPTSAHEVLRFGQPQSNHNGGWIGFNPAATGAARHYLYVSSGDGGGGNDDDTGHAAGSGNGLSLQTLLGKMLRIDVNADDFPVDTQSNYGIPANNPFVGIPGLNEIWAFGLRNPWRCSFDRATGDLWIADVGQDDREEIDVLPGNSSGGENFGWRLREGTIATPTAGIGGSAPPGAVDPILDYPRTSPGTPVINGGIWGRSTTGGYVYRGTAMPWLQGTYFFADFVSSKVWSLRCDVSTSTVSELADRSTELTPDVGTLTKISAFGEDATSELYIVSLDGGIFQVTQSPYNLWRNSVFSVNQIADPMKSGPDADLDDDGNTTVQEFVVGFDPTVPDGSLPLTPTIADDGGDDFLTITLARDPQSAGMVSLQGETGPAPDALTPASTVTLEDSSSIFSFRDTVPVSNATNRFGAIRFELSGDN